MTLAVTYWDLQEEVARELGWSRDAGEWSEVQDSDFTLGCNAGLRKFYSGEIAGEGKAHNWSFMYPLGTLAFTATYAAGTLGIAAGTVTATDTGVTSWPTWADEGQLWITDSSGETVVTDVTTRTDAEFLVVENTTLTGTVLTYKLLRLNYDMPADFGGMYSDSFTYRRDEQWHLPSIGIIGESDLRRMDREVNTELYPRYASLLPVAPTTTTETSWQVRFYPLPSTAYEVEYRYKVSPPKLSPSNIYPYGGAFYGEAIVAAVLDAMTQRIHSSMEHHDRYLSAMRQAIFHDRRNFSFHTLGSSPDGRRDYSLNRFRRSTSITNSNLDFS